MTERQYVQKIAERYKAQYVKYKKWITFFDWERQPEQQYIVLRELKTFEAVEALLNESWTRRARQCFKAEQRRKKKASSV